MRAWSTAAARALPVTLVVAASLGLVAVEGGFNARDWMPVALGFAGLLLACALQGWSWPASRPAQIALGLLGGLVVWELLSMLWAGLPGSAWDSADRLLLYVLAAAVFASYPWSATTARRLLLAWTLGLALVLVISALYAAGFDDPRDVMINGRFSYPIGYAGGSAALAALGLCPAVLLSSRPEVHPALRVLLLASGALFALFALLPQSRGAVFGVAAAAVVVVALAPQRPRVAVRLVLLGLIVWLTSGPVLDAYTSFEEKTVDPDVLDHAWRAMALAALLAGACGGLLALVERRIGTPRPALVRAGRRAVVIGLAVLALGGVAVVAANGAGIRDEAHDRWTEFKGGTGVAASGPSRFTATGDPVRYDYWRVALEAFGDHPVAGLGAGNYEPLYARERDHPKYARYPHSLWMALLAETGIVGIALFVGAIGFAAAAVLAGRRGLDHPGRAAVAGCLAVTACLLGHASVDWVDQLPSVAIPGLGFLFVATRVAEPRISDRASAGGSLAVRAGVAVVAVLAFVALVLPYASVRFSERAVRSWRVDPGGALSDLDRAESVNPLSARIQLQEASIAIELRRYRRARAALQDATDVSDSWFAHLQLALLDARAGRFAAARRQIERARALNPTEPFVRSTRAAIRRRERLDPRQVNRELRHETRAQFR